MLAQKSFRAAGGKKRFLRDGTSKVPILDEIPEERGMDGGGHAAGLRLVVPGAALLITLGLFGYFVASGTIGDRAPLRTASSAAQNAPAASPRTPAMPPYLGNESGAVSGTLANDADSASIARSHISAIEAGDINSDFAVSAGWNKNLRAAFGDFRSQDSQVLFAGNVFNMRGTIPHADRDWMIGSLRSAQLPQIVVAELTGGGAASMRKTSSASKLDSGGNESVRLPNQATSDFPIINFPANSAKVPSSSLPLLRRIAEQIKQLPPGTVVQLNGYTHSTRSSAADLELAQRRAEAVSQVLIHEGVAPALLRAKGYGGSPSVASINGITEGRSSKIMGEGGRQRYDRRVEFRVLPQRP